jgi:hypothetical protein
MVSDKIRSTVVIVVAAVRSLIERDSNEIDQANNLRVLVETLLAAGDNLRQHAEAVASGRLGKRWAVPALLHLVFEESTFGDRHCNRLRPVVFLGHCARLRFRWIAVLYCSCCHLDLVKAG